MVLFDVLGKGNGIDPEHGGDHTGIGLEGVFEKPDVHGLTAGRPVGQHLELLPGHRGVHVCADDLTVLLLDLGVRHAVGGENVAALVQVAALIPSAGSCSLLLVNVLVKLAFRKIGFLLQ